MSENWRRAEAKWPFWTKPAMRAVQVTTVRDGVNERTSWAELGRSSLEYMLTRWLKRKEDRGVSRVLMIWAWVARPRREERVETADSSRAARELGVRKGMVGNYRHGCWCWQSC